MIISILMLLVVYLLCKNNEIDYVFFVESVIFFVLFCSFLCKEKLGVVLGVKC